MLHTSLKDSEPGAMATPLCAFSVSLSSLWNVSRSLATFWNLPSCESERGRLTVRWRSLSMAVRFSLKMKYLTTSANVRGR